MLYKVGVVNGLDQIVLEKAAKLFYRTIITKVIEPGLKELDDDQLTQVQLSCLRFALLHPEPSVGDIAEGLLISDAASAKLIDRLVRKNLLIREENPVDRRVLKIKLTGEAEKLLEKVNTIEHQLFQEILSRMTPEATQSLQNGLTAFLEAALKSPEEIDRVCLKCGWDHFPECPGNVRYHQLTGKDKENR
jgi:DNA-binding MarR family transcriptional regulator